MALKRSIQRTRTPKIPADSQEDRVKILNFRETTRGTKPSARN